jgi:hypothetical protein
MDKKYLTGPQARQHLTLLPMDSMRYECGVQGPPDWNRIEKWIRNMTTLRDSLTGRRTVSSAHHESPYVSERKSYRCHPFYIAEASAALPFPPR